MNVQYSANQQFVAEQFVTEESEVLGETTQFQIDWLLAEYLTFGFIPERKALQALIVRYVNEPELIADMMPAFVKAHLTYKYPAGKAPAYFMGAV